MAGKILIVEDEAAIARFVELELRHEGYAVDKTEDGRSGLDQALAEAYDLILLGHHAAGALGAGGSAAAAAGEGHAGDPADGPGHGDGQGLRPGYGR